MDEKLRNDWCDKISNVWYGAIVGNFESIVEEIYAAGCAAQSLADHIAVVDVLCGDKGSLLDDDLIAALIAAQIKESK